MRLVSRRRALLTCLVAGVVTPPARSATGEALPTAVLAALERAKVPRTALCVVVQEAGSAVERLAWNAARAVNPASLMKLVTSFAALDLLGPAWTWTTPVWLQGNVRDPGPDGVLDGNLVIKGSGDPKLVLERIWLLLRRVQQAGVREIRGDIVLDRSAFGVTEQSPGEFDGEPLRPYNAQPDALLLNYKSLLLNFTPDATRGVAVIAADPPLARVRLDAAVPLRVAAACDDWRNALRLDVSDPGRIRFLGHYTSGCGQKTWPLAYAEPASYNARLIEALWREGGGRLTGVVRDGAAPDALPSFEVASAPLAEVVRDINKYSNNVMAQQLFLTLGLQFRGIGSADAARDVLGAWLRGRLGERAAEVVVDNGSGLSRGARVSASALAQLLQQAWASPVMPEFVASLPILGQDGTLRRAQAMNGTPSAGRAHLKTGSLRDVAGIAGYVLSTRGQRYVLVAVVNHPNANAARPALDALVDWTLGAEPTVARP